MQKYNTISKNTQLELRNLSFISYTVSGKRKEIRNQILYYLQYRDLTARELSVYIKCMRSSVCKALQDLIKNNQITGSQTAYDKETNRNVTLYSLIINPSENDIKS